jgi:cytochrome b subunit of formate dehydrogenase
MVDWKELDKTIERHANEFQRLLEDALDDRKVFVTGLSFDGVVSVSNAVAAIALYRSTKRVEKLTYVLVGLTTVLAILTGVTLWRIGH